MSTTLAHNYKLLIKTFAVISPKRQWPPRTAIPARHNVPLLDIRQRFQSARTRMATLSYDIRQYFPGIADDAA
jgi:hypothetical protein